MNCACHSEPMYWQKDKRATAGGGWLCAVKARARSRANYHGRFGEQKRRQQRARYDADPVYRLGKNLHDGARRRRDTLTRKREALSEPLPLEG